MELSNLKTLNIKLAGMALAGLLPLTAHAHGAPRVSGEVQVVHQVPGGVITVGAEWGRRPAPQPQVVVVEDRRPDVVVIEKRGHGRRHRKHHREVTIIREEPRREVTIIRREAPRKVVVVEEKASCGRGGDGYTRSHEWSDGRQVSVDRQGPAGNYHYYSDGNQVSVDKQGPNGNYHYYEDARQVSIQDNRDGRQRNVYVRK